MGVTGQGVGAWLRKDLCDVMRSRRLASGLLGNYSGSSNGRWREIQKDWEAQTCWTLLMRV